MLGWGFSDEEVEIESVHEGQESKDVNEDSMQMHNRRKRKGAAVESIVEFGPPIRKSRRIEERRLAKSKVAKTKVD